MKTRFSFFILLALFLQVKAQTLVPEQLQHDFDLFQKALHEVHPQMYLYTSKPAFDSLFVATKATLIQPMSQHEFYKTMTPLIAALHDGHVKWLVAGHDQHYPFFTQQLFPLKIYAVENRAWITANYGEINIPLGAEILSINGQSMASIIQFLLPSITFADGYTRQGKFEELNHFFSGYYATYIGPSNSFEIEYRDGNEQKSVSLPAVTEDIIKSYTQKYKPAPQKPFRLTYPTAETAVMTIERFWDDKKEQDYKDFLKKSFKELKEKQIQNLVLDVRNNEGGNEPYGLLLYSYLAQHPFRYYNHIKVAQKKKISFAAWTPGIYTKFIRKFMVIKSGDNYVFNFPKMLKETKPKKEAFTGALYVLVNGNSFSVTTEYSARVHADGRATFIGQETAGGYRTNSSGMFTIVQLPNSKIDLGIPMFGFQMANVPSHIRHGQGIIPDHVVVPSVEDILKKQDKVMEYTLQLIANKSAAMPASSHK